MSTDTIPDARTGLLGRMDVSLCEIGFRGDRSARVRRVLCSCFRIGRRIPIVWLGAGISLAVSGLVLGGMRRSSLANIVIVSATLLALALFVACAMPVAFSVGRGNLLPLFPWEDRAGAGFLQACALMFVAYTGYGRIATMGEEVKDPLRIIPKATIAAMVVAAVIYSAVGIAAIGAYGAPSAWRGDSKPCCASGDRVGDDRLSRRCPSGCAGGNDRDARCAA